jgi:NarL family two-component system response regulator LiaR
MAIRVLLADDHTLFRQGVRQILRSYQGIEVVGEAEDGEEACQLTFELQPDVVVMDMHMPRMDGVRATRTIMQHTRPPAIIILTMSRQDDYVFEAIKAGARGYYLKDADSRVLIEAIETAAAGETVLEPSLAQRVLREFRNPTGAHQRVNGLSSLDDREIDILRRVAAGQTNQAIGEALGLSEKTIKNQLSQTFQKLQLENRTQAAIYALRHGLVTLEELSA